MIVRCLASAIILLSLAGVFASSAAARSNEPFTSFRWIDKRLSILNAAVPRLQTASATERKRTLRLVQVAARDIQHRSTALVNRYRGNRFGVRMFTSLHERAVSVSRSLDALQRAKTGPEQQREEKRVSAATLALVLKFQAVSGNYGATHCERREWSCCEPKRDPETNEDVMNACQWMCVAHANSCSGFLGPQTLKSY